MNRPQPYHQITAVFFLLLYVLIATPVQLWHHHHLQKAGKTEQTSSGPLLCKQNGTRIGEDPLCTICQHHPPVFISSGFCQFQLNTVTQSQTFYRLLRSDLVCMPVSVSINKGPPSLA